MPTVEVSCEADDQLAPGECPRVAHGQHRCLGAAHGEAHPFGARNQASDLLGPRDLELVAGAIVGALVHLFGDRVGYLRMVMAQ